MFGIFPEDLHITPKPSVSKTLDSSITHKLPNGTTKRARVLKGDFFIELKVYNTEDIRGELPDQRWKKSLLAVKAQIDADSSQWESLEKFVKQVKKLFEDVDVKFYSSTY